MLHYCMREQKRKMRSSQWSILGLTLIFLTFSFIWIDNLWGKNCGVSDIQPTQPDLVLCINGEIYDPFIYFFGALSIAFLINAFIEAHHEKKKH